MTPWHLAKIVGGPGSIGFLVVLIALGLGIRLLGGRRWQGRARIWMAAVLLFYVVLSLPVVAMTLVGWLRPPPPRSDEALRGVRGLFVFDGDNRRGRIREAERVYALAGPQMVWLLGAAYMTDDLVMAGTPRDRIHLDTTATDTRTQVLSVKRLLGSADPATAAVVASRLQMPRVARFARAAGLDVQLVPAPLDDEPAQAGWRRCLPSWPALMVSRDAIYELAANAYYARDVGP